MSPIAMKQAAWLAAGLLALGGAACEKHDKGPIAPTDTRPPLAAQDTVVPGGELTTVPARTGSQASGTEGSSTVIGAPPKGQTGAAFAH